MKDKKVSGRVGFCELLAIAFIVLKLLKVIDWSWWLVLAPLWIPLVIALIILAVLKIAEVIVERMDDKDE